MQPFLYVSKDIGMKGCPRSWVLSAGPSGGAGAGRPPGGRGEQAKAGTSGSAGWTARLWPTEDLGSPQLWGPAAWCHAGEGTGAGARPASDGLAGRRGLLGRDGTGTGSAE